MFDGVKSLFSGVRSLFSGQPNQEYSVFKGAYQDFTGQSAPPGMGNIPEVFIGSPRPLVDSAGQNVPHGQPGLLHAYTSASLWNTETKTYSWRWDEAYSRCRADALAMRRDPFVQGLVFERKFPTAQMSWHTEPDDKKDRRQQKHADYLKACIDTLPNVTEMLMILLDGLWYGREGAQLVWDYKQVLGRRSYIPVDIVPTNGDKIQFEWDGTPQVRLYGGTDISSARREEVFTGIIKHDPRILREDTVWTDLGLMLRLKRSFWRDRWVIYKHDIIDSDFYESDKAGGVHGVGIRNWIYWFWWIRQEVGSYLLDFLERTGMGFTVYYYDPGNPAEQAKAIQIAKQQSRNTWIVWPRAPGSEGAQKGVERIEPGQQGAATLKDLLAYYDGYIERFIIGQTMSSGADNESGLGGSGRANFARATKQYIITHDCLKLASALSTDLVMKIHKFNPPEEAGEPFECRWKFDIDAADPEAKLKAGESLVKMGVRIKQDELRSVAGFEKPAPDDETVGGQSAMPGAPGGQKGPGEVFEGKPNGKPPNGATGLPAPANGTPKTTGNTLETEQGTFTDKERERHQPVRYSGGGPVELALYIYQDDDEVAKVALGEHSEWEPFAKWASEQGGELARLAHTGHTDEFRLAHSLIDLAADLDSANVPEKYHALAGKIRDAIKDHAEAEGLLVAAKDDAD